MTFEEQFFTHVVMLCEKAGLIEGNKIFLDTTLLKANASMEFLTERRPYRELQTPEQSGVLPTIPYPKPRKTMREKKLEAGSVYDEKENIYYCPQGKKMYRMDRFSEGTALYRVHRCACRGCAYRGTLCKAKRPSIKTSCNDELIKMGQWTPGDQSCETQLEGASSSG